MFNKERNSLIGAFAELGKALINLQEELVNDMMMLIASFSDKVYSLRAKENRNKLKENKNNEN